MSEGFFSGQFCITIIMIVQLQCVNKFCAVFLIVAYQLEQSGLTADTVLTKENYEDIVKVFMDNWDIVVKRFEHSNKAAEEYYRNAIGNSKSACIVDIGWAASGFSDLRYLIEDQWQIDCKVTGLVAGSTYLHDMDIIESIAQSVSFSTQRAGALKKYCPLTLKKWTRFIYVPTIFLLAGT